MKIKIEYEAEIPDIECTDKEIEEFIRYECGDTGSMSRNNPFIEEIIEPIFGTFGWDHA